VLIAALIACTAIFWQLLTYKVNSRQKREATAISGEEGVK